MHTTANIFLIFITHINIITLCYKKCLSRVCMSNNRNTTPINLINYHQQHPKHHATPLQAKLVLEFITLSKYQIYINNDTEGQSVAVPGATTTYCRVGLSYLLSYLQVIIVNLYSDWMKFPFIESVVELRRLELLTPCLQSRCSPNWATAPLINCL